MKKPWFIPCEGYFLTFLITTDKLLFRESTLNCFIFSLSPSNVNIWNNFYTCLHSLMNYKYISYRRLVIYPNSNIFKTYQMSTASNKWFLLE